MRTPVIYGFKGELLILYIFDNLHSSINLFNDFVFLSLIIYMDGHYEKLSIDL